jgi:hypothetical protein
MRRFGAISEAGWESPRRTFRSLLGVSSSDSDESLQAVTCPIAARADPAGAHWIPTETVTS